MVFFIVEMHTGFRERRVRIRSRSNQHVWTVWSYWILCAVGQSSDQKDMWCMHRIITFALLHDRFQQLCKSDVVAVGNHVRERSIPKPSQLDSALWYATFYISILVFNVVLSRQCLNIPSTYILRDYNTWL